MCLEKRVIHATTDLAPKDRHLCIIHETNASNPSVQSLKPEDANGALLVIHPGQRTILTLLPDFLTQHHLQILSSREANIRVTLPVTP
jgi:hypothetical protein